MTTTQEIPEGKNTSFTDLEEDTAELSLADIYNQLLVLGELIVTIPMEEEETLRKGLAGVKAKQNQKLKSSGLAPDPATLSFTVSPNKEQKGAIDVHIVLAKRTSITVLGIKKPDPEI
jgi:hypothetical protein